MFPGYDIHRLKGSVFTKPWFKYFFTSWLTNKISCCSQRFTFTRGRGDYRAVPELSFGQVTTKTWAYSGVFGFFRKNPAYRRHQVSRAIRIVEPIQIWIGCMIFFFSSSPPPPRRRREWTFILFFLQHANLRISCIFWFGHFPRSGIKSDSSFLMKCYIITVLKKNPGAFCPKKWRSKKWISHCIFKKRFWLGWGMGQFFTDIFFLKKPSTPEYAQVLVVMWAKLKSVAALLSPRPILEVGSN